MSDDIKKQIEEEELDKISGGVGGGLTHPMPRDPIRPPSTHPAPEQPPHRPSNPVGGG